MNNKIMSLTLLLTVFGSDSIAANVHRLKTLNRGGTDSDSGWQLIDECVKSHKSCLVDFTAHERCTANPATHELGSNFDATLDGVVAKCPMYHWRKRGDIYVIEPRKKSDSVLNVPVKAIHLTVTAKVLIEIAADLAGLTKSTNDVGNGIRSSNSHPDRSVAFDLPPATLKGSLIEAAKQSQPSVWLIHYKRNSLGEESLDFHADTYDLPKVEK